MNRIMAALLAATAVVQPAMAQDAAPSLEQRFGARAGVIDAKLSPSGNRIVLVAPEGEDGEVVLVSDLSAAEPGWSAAMRNDRPLTDLRQCDWAGERHLICTLRGTSADAGLLIGFTRLVSVDVESGSMQSLTARQSSRAIGLHQDGGEVLSWKVAGESPDTVLLTRYNLEESTTGSNIRGPGEGLGAETIQLSNMRRRRTEPSRGTAQWYLADENGAVRLVRDREMTGTGLCGKASAATSSVSRERIAGARLNWVPGRRPTSCRSRWMARRT
ncbi:hypothetical protein V5740_04935 [Croceibacterium sp. TMG7-5b_MA50]|uniref:hypothetical protein n=1 Tax=Croceibacterium sp. TMG7-5b_MA50 TaxID=3121290 RepID=UPI0032213F92